MYPPLTRVLIQVTVIFAFGLIASSLLSPGNQENNFLFWSGIGISYLTGALSMKYYVYQYLAKQGKLKRVE